MTMPNRALSNQRDCRDYRSLVAKPWGDRPPSASSSIGVVELPRDGTIVGLVSRNPLKVVVRRRVSHFHLPPQVGRLLGCENDADGLRAFGKSWYGRGSLKNRPVESSDIGARIRNAYDLHRFFAARIALSLTIAASSTWYLQCGNDRPCKDSRRYEDRHRVPIGRDVVRTKRSDQSAGETQ